MRTETNRGVRIGVDLHRRPVTRSHHSAPGASLSLEVNLTPEADGPGKIIKLASLKADLARWKRLVVPRKSRKGGLPGGPIVSRVRVQRRAVRQKVVTNSAKILQSKFANRHACLLQSTTPSVSTVNCPG